MKKSSVRLRDGAGLHARPADLFVRAARGFRAQVVLRHGPAVADGKEIVQVLLLGVGAGATVELEVDGPDEESGFAALSAILARAPTTERLGKRRAEGQAWRVALGRSSPGEALEEALADTAKELEAQRVAVAAAAGDELGAILDAQAALLADALVPEIRTRAGRGLATETAVREATAALASMLASAGSELVRSRSADIEELGERVLAALHGMRRQLPSAGGPWIVVTPRLDAGLVADARGRPVAGFLTSGVDPTAHAWILARGLGLPVSSVTPERLAEVVAGSALAVVDESVGAPEEPSSRSRRILVRANVASAEEAIDAFALGMDGIGVVRTELVFAARASAPSVAEQLVAYLSFLLPFGPHPVTLRLFDAGGDKRIPFLPGRAEPRGIARLAQQPLVLRDQVRAIEAAAEHGVVRLLVPYVEAPESLVGLSERVPVGAMIESAAGALCVEAIVEAAEFVSIGTNDLVASVLRRPRAETAPADLLRPEPWSMLERVVSAAKRRGREVSVCGEAAALPEVAPRLVALGVDALSVSPKRFAETARWVEAE